MVLHKLFVTKEHAVLAVNRHDEFRADRLSHDANVFLRGVAADMNQPAFFFDDIRALLIYETNELGDRAFVAGNDAC